MCPPGTDQTTRTSPRWNILALDVEQIQKLPEHQDPQKLLASGTSLNAWQRLYRLSTPLFHHNSPLHRPSTPNTSTPAGKVANVPSSVTTSSSVIQPLAETQCHFDTCPPEILSLITAFLSTEPESLIALALCSRRLWHHVVAGDLFRLGGSSRAGIWAGQPLICTSTWLTGLPDSVLAHCPQLVADMEEWNARSDPQGQVLVGIRNGRGRYRALGLIRGMNPVRRWNWNAYGQWKDVGECNNPQRIFVEAYEKHIRSELSDGRIGRRLACSLRGALARALDPLEMSSAESWILRNLDTREYVRFVVSGSDDTGTHKDAEKAKLPLTPDSSDIAGDDGAHNDDDNDDSEANQGPPLKKRKQTNSSTPAAAEDKAKFLAVPGSSWLTPDYVILSQIYWCDYHVLQHHPLLRKLWQGAWAGHRFDIVEAGRDTELHLPATGAGKQDGGKSEWADVTDQILETCTRLREYIASVEL
ncbi:uncharacterized protein B0I36DRAFT_335431 [Microdochium trichocladiopsis]|uniref:F-box domain-containing protein n=1 Tax=Microdochium trichocladiopsis TaxID=1682393 RepID=A0A9P9BMU7_9PEZI|nr:uncharacterized protein B0I36DRAFT_335431 [Microdochium trichocladiopsis]KAH7018167.1 hypothetical protein B0I36DRAFT_335431 [Microdochium trichocladiopsis]